MASDLKTVAFITDQSGLGARLAYKRMFGEFALYLDSKVVALIHVLPQAGVFGAGRCSSACWRRSWPTPISTVPCRA